MATVATNRSQSSSASGVAERHFEGILDVYRANDWSHARRPRAA